MLWQVMAGGTNIMIFVFYPCSLTSGQMAAAGHTGNISQCDILLEMVLGRNVVVIVL